MILSRYHILARLKNDEIFRPGSWCENCLTEASYVLRVAPDGLMLEDNQYPPNGSSCVETIEIEPGKIAILSTMERLQMPGDLVGKIGIRFDYATQGLTGLMGIQVDPFFGWGHDDERLYIRVANLGNEKITIYPEDGVFTFELHQLSGVVHQPSSRRGLMWKRLRDILRHQENTSWSNVTRVQSDVEESKKETEKRITLGIAEVRQYLQPLVMFGIFLVAVTILGASLTVFATLRETPETDVPEWITDWGWALLLVTLSIATLATAAVGVATVWKLLRGK